MSHGRPNFYLADLPPEAHFTPQMVTEACRNLKTNREKFLRERSTASIVQILSALAEDWLSADFPYRKMALTECNIPPATLARGLDAFFAQLTPANFDQLLTQDLGNSLRLERMLPDAAGRVMALAHGPTLLTHITAGNVPAPALMSMVLGLLLRSAQFLKCATGTSLLPRLFAHSLYDRQPKLGACIEIAEWRGGSRELEQPLFAASDCVTATGSDETLAEIRRDLPAHVRFIPYGHRVSFGYVTAESLTRRNATQAAEQAANDIVAWNQLGCLSPHLFYVELNGSLSPEQFAEFLAAELERREHSEPRGSLPVEDAAMIAGKRNFYQVRAAHSPDTRLWSSRESTAWTVVFETDPQFQLSCLHRFVFVKPVKDLAEALRAAASVKGKVSTIGLAAPPGRAQALAHDLALWGATRICPLGQMQNPPLTWRHDGRPALADLVTWTDWEH